MGILKWLGLTTDVIEVKSPQRSLLKPCDDISIEEFEDLIEARKLMAGKPLNDEFT